MKPPRVLVVFGSNLAPERNVRAAVEALHRDVGVVALSTVYRTAALGRPEQPPFYNGALELDTDLPPRVLKYGVLRPLEVALGRVRTADRYAARTIDLDLALYGDLVAATDDLVLPDPDIATRPFLAVPLAEIAPDLPVPGTGQTLSQIAAEFAGAGLEPLVDYTRDLRRAIGHEPCPC
ncbi:MAG: 2-amino-4-hydroxy-6-hydroxymethyldihydropteridine diphosphokinase [Armatimonadetes bacterium]|nr:2-amino-4-hydroxy-6-hydroxymethyldihydropteridine diphosphokinase [Armatimonadota bacterium]